MTKSKMSKVVLSAFAVTMGLTSVTTDVANAQEVAPTQTDVKSDTLGANTYSNSAVQALIAKVGVDEELLKDDVKTSSDSKTVETKMVNEPVSKGKNHKDKQKVKETKETKKDKKDSYKLSEGKLKRLNIDKTRSKLKEVNKLLSVDRKTLKYTEKDIKLLEKEIKDIRKDLVKLTERELYPLEKEYWEVIRVLNALDDVEEEKETETVITDSIDDELNDDDLLEDDVTSDKGNSDDEDSDDEDLDDASNKEDSDDDKDLDEEDSSFDMTNVSDKEELSEEVDTSNPATAEGYLSNEIYMSLDSNMITNVKQVSPYTQTHLDTLRKDVISSGVFSSLDKLDTVAPQLEELDLRIQSVMNYKAKEERKIAEINALILEKEQEQDLVKASLEQNKDAVKKYRSYIKQYNKLKKSGKLNVELTERQAKSGVGVLSLQTARNGSSVVTSNTSSANTSSTGGYTGANGQGSSDEARGNTSSGENISTSNLTSLGTAPALAQNIINYGYNFIGVPYVWGGSTPNGFDCSGLMQYVFAKHGVYLPRVARQQQTVGVPVSFNNLQPGDLIFIHQPATHVALYIGDGYYLHAPQPGDKVKISKFYPQYWTNARRVIFASDADKAKAISQAEQAKAEEKRNQAINKPSSSVNQPISTDRQEQLQQNQSNQGIKPNTSTNNNVSKPKPTNPVVQEPTFEVDEDTATDEVVEEKVKPLSVKPAADEVAVEEEPETEAVVETSSVGVVTE